jgi:hypothetical protein
VHSGEQTPQLGSRCVVRLWLSSVLCECECDIWSVEEGDLSHQEQVVRKLCRGKRGRQTEVAVDDSVPFTGKNVPWHKTRSIGVGVGPASTNVSARTRGSPRQLQQDVSQTGVNSTRAATAVGCTKIEHGQGSGGDEE